ncbi:MAG: hypothetical protein DWQ36_18820 [Acidobacteria bacterium]|nr:MAG: hypothetical protein DWQ30_03620 [Acidobacteriota bacterium]REK03827.1 MAG: hypothetical protein DWQ36_18820 [Acidobacteriota bacterium]
MLKKLLFTTATALAVVALVEALGAVSLRLTEGSWVGWRTLEARRAALRPEPELRDDSRAARRARQIRGRHDEGVLHPYLGYVLHPSGDASNDLDGSSGAPARESDAVAGEGFKAAAVTAGDALGFPDNRQPLIQRRSADKLLVGVFGGSVANIFVDTVGERFADQLAGLDAYRGRDVSVLSLAAGGYKQPQQLMALNYLLALGGELDLVIVIDGFNEVALPPHELVPHGVSPVYPRSWRTLVAERDPTLLRATGELLVVRRRRQQRALRWSAPLLGQSLFAGSLWASLDRRDGRRLAELETSLRDASLIVESRQMLGPPLPSGVDPVAAMVDVWARSSLQMSSLCEGLGIAYLHVLQPNQYVPGSKPLSDTERRTAFLADHAYRPGVLAGYPLLRRAGAELSQRGVAFLDATDLFSDAAQTLYVDDCCHFNPEGNTLLADAIVDSLRGSGLPAPTTEAAARR